MRIVLAAKISVPPNTRGKKTLTLIRQGRFTPVKVKKGKPYTFTGVFFVPHFLKERFPKLRKTFQNITIQLNCITIIISVRF